MSCFLGRLRVGDSGQHPAEERGAAHGATGDGRLAEERGPGVAGDRGLVLADGTVDVDEVQIKIRHSRRPPGEDTDPW